MTKIFCLNWRILFEFNSSVKNSQLSICKFSINYCRRTKTYLFIQIIRIACSGWLMILWYASLPRDRAASSAWHPRREPKSRAENLAASSTWIQWPRARWSGWSDLSRIRRVDLEEVLARSGVVCAPVRSACVCMCVCGTWRMSSSCFFHEPIHPPLDLGDQSDTFKVEWPLREDELSRGGDHARRFIPLSRAPRVFQGSRDPS